MRWIVGVLMVLVAASPLHAGHVQGPDDGAIVPGDRIGSARLGITADEIEVHNRDALCPVTAVRDADGRAIRLITTWGGGCRVNGHIQVGVALAPVLHTFGRPDGVAEDARYDHATAYWVTYGGWGIAFRVVVMADGSALIQAIAVFPGTAQARGRPANLPAPLPWDGR